VGQATQENVRRAIAGLKQRMTKDDQLLVLLIGHGSGEGEAAAFNLVGPDLRVAEWADLLKGLPGRLVFVDTTGASFAFLHALAGRERIVLTAADSAAQQFETVFPEFFVKAFGDQAADADKNGRISIWEAFAYASAQTKDWYEQHGRLATERALLDDTGAGIGREASVPGPDGELARVTYLDLHNSGAAGNAEMTALLARKAELEDQIDKLRSRKSVMPPDEYAATLEKLLIELARVSQQIRAKS
jgi:HPt (histidine-containing phosphotransfer) domain-containing protein